MAVTVVMVEKAVTVAMVFLQLAGGKVLLVIVEVHVTEIAISATMNTQQWAMALIQMV